MCGSCSRRVFIGGAAASLALAQSRMAGASDILTGCGFGNADIADLERRSTSGNDDLDQALITELQHILSVIPNINPGFQYLVDTVPNSYASRATLLPGTKGTVLFGINLINDLMKAQEGGAAVAGMCAHECGHIYQYDNDLDTQLGTTLLVELHADFLAGIYMGKRAESGADHVREFSDALHGAGDYAYGDPRYHGTPGQRSAAMEKGYRLASSGKSYQELAVIGETYVRNLA